MDVIVTIVVIGLNADYQPPAGLFIRRVRRHQQAQRLEHGLRGGNARGLQVPRDGVQDRGYAALHEGDVYALC